MRISSELINPSCLGFPNPLPTMRPASTTPTALVLIDIQEGFKHPTHWGNSRSTPTFEHNVEGILGSFRGYNSSAPEGRAILIIHVHHHSTSPTSALHPSHYLEGSSTPSVAALPFAAPLGSERLGSEPVFTKNFNSAFVGTELESTLRSAGIRQLVVVGLTTDHCVSTTARMAANLQVLGDDGGPDGNGEGVHGIVLVRDATATYEKGGFDAETVHGVSLASLDGEFAQVVSTDSLMKGILEMSSSSS
ncbi:isochorismatase hydrolase [Colletotrichum cereale]|nr:isochorismatase hydrolase [Colletotrichum cereale]